MLTQQTAVQYEKYGFTKYQRSTVKGKVNCLHLLKTAITLWKRNDP